VVHARRRRNRWAGRGWLRILAFLPLVIALLAFPGTATRADWEGGHCASGLENASQSWYFAEGCTREGFEEWVCVVNPGGDPGQLLFHFLTGDGEGGSLQCTVPPRSRLTLHVNQAAGTGLDVSVALESTVPVAAERAMYFRYGKGGLAGGHAEHGAVEASPSWYFAEGTTRAGFETWLCVANPHPEKARARVDLILGTGQGENRSLVMEVAGRSRSTLLLNDLLPPGCDVSVILSSDRPVVAERPVYFSYRGKWEGGHVALGAEHPSSSWYFAEGSTRTGFEEWLCLLNPGESEAAASLRFMGQYGLVKEIRLTVPPRRRATGPIAPWSAR